VDNFFQPNHLPPTATGVPAQGTGMPLTLKAKGGMENGDHEPEQQEQRPARQYFTEYCPNPKGQLADGQRYQHPDQDSDSEYN